MIAGSERAAWPPTTTGSQSLLVCAVHLTSWRIKDVLPAPGAPLKHRVWPPPRPLDTMSMAAAAAVRSPSRPEKNGSGASPARSTSAIQSSYGTSSCCRSRPSSGTDMGAVISTRGMMPHLARAPRTGRMPSAITATMPQVPTETETNDGHDRADERRRAHAAGPVLVGHRHLLPVPGGTGPAQLRHRARRGAALDRQRNHRARPASRSPGGARRVRRCLAQRAESFGQVVSPAATAPAGGARRSAGSAPARCGRSPSRRPGSRARPASPGPWPRTGARPARPARAPWRR